MKFKLSSALIATPPVTEGPYFMEIKKIGFGQTKKEHKPTLDVVLGFTEAEVMDYAGGEALNNSAHNLTVFDSIQLGVTEKLTIEMITLKIAKFVNAVLRDKQAFKTVGDFDNETKETQDLVASFVGKYVKVIIKYDPAKDGYDAKNKVGGYYAITEADGFNEPAF